MDGKLLWLNNGRFSFSLRRGLFLITIASDKQSKTLDSKPETIFVYFSAASKASESTGSKPLGGSGANKDDKNTWKRVIEDVLLSIAFEVTVDVGFYVPATYFPPNTS